MLCFGLLLVSLATQLQGKGQLSLITTSIYICRLDWMVHLGTVPLYHAMLYYHIMYYSVERQRETQYGFNK